MCQPKLVASEAVFVYRKARARVTLKEVPFVPDTLSLTESKVVVAGVEGRRGGSVCVWTGRRYPIRTLTRNQGETRCQKALDLPCLAEHDSDQAY